MRTLHVSATLLLAALVLSMSLAGCANRGPATDSTVGHRWDRDGRDRAAHERTDTGETADAEEPAPPSPPPPPARTTRTAGTPPQRDGMVSAVTYYPTGERSTSALEIVKYMPLETRLGSPFTYEIVATNLTNVELADVVVTDQPSDNLSVSGSTPSHTASAGNLVWDLGVLAPSASRTIEVEAVASAGTTASACTTATYNTTLCLATRVVEPQLQITKTATEQATPCEEIELLYTVTNSGTGVVSGARVEDTLPAGLATAQGNRDISFAVDPLGPGESRTYRVRTTAARTGTFSSAATVSGDGLTATSDAPSTVVTQAVLEIEVDCVSTRYLGAPASFDVTVRNTGDAPALNTTLNAPVPSGTQFVDATAGGMLSGSSVAWDLGTIAPGASRNVTFRASPLSIGTINATATASAVCASDVSGACSTEIRGIPAVLLEVVDQTDPVLVGEQTTYLIVVTNQGSATDRDIDVVATIPSGSTFVSATGPAGTTATADDQGVIDFPEHPTLAPGAKVEWRVTVRADREGDVRFRCSLRTAELDTDAERVTETEATRFYSFE